MVIYNGLWISLEQPLENDRMTSISFEPNELGARLRADARNAPKSVLNAIVSSAHRGRALLVKESPVYRGILRNAWRVMKIRNGAQLVNDQPYAGVVERGSRPFKISKAGIEALVLWVKRKLLDGGMGFFTGSKASQRQAVQWAAKLQKAENKGRGRNKQFGPKRDVNFSRLKGQVRAKVAELEKQAQLIAYKIASKFKRVGMKGQRFVYKNLDKLSLLMEQEINRALSSFFNRAKGQDGLET